MMVFEKVGDDLQWNVKQLENRKLLKENGH